tara:strand:- start:469 stop:687 length:219 start_codon:yes stop_codon:yes gene_type:complete
MIKTTKQMVCDVCEKESKPVDVEFLKGGVVPEETKNWITLTISEDDINMSSDNNKNYCSVKCIHTDIDNRFK